MPATPAAARTWAAPPLTRPSAMFSAIDREKRNPSCGTYPRPARRDASGISVTSRPSTKSVPTGGSQSRASRSPSVDLPLPVGPTTATVSPGPTSKLTSRSAGARYNRAGSRLSQATLDECRAHGPRYNNLLDAVHRGQAAAHDRERPAERDRRPGEVREIAVERDERAEAQAAVHDGSAARPEHDERTDARDQPHQGRESGLGPREGEAQAQVFPVGPTKVGARARLERVRAHHGHAAQIFLDSLRQDAELILGCLRPVVDLQVEAPRQ